MIFGLIAVNIQSSHGGFWADPKGTEEGSKSLVPFGVGLDIT